VGNSFFHFQQFSIFSQDKGLKVNSDACILGAIAEFDNPIHCLDIGTGTGVIALFLAQRYPNTQLTAIEIEKSVYEQAINNIQKSVFNKQIVAINADALEYPFNHTFDLIVCNPPYFKNHLEKADSEKNRAIHNKTLDPVQLIKRIKEILNPNGLFWLIYPPQEAIEFKKMAETHHLFAVKEILIYNKPQKHYRSILCLSLANNKPAEAEHFNLTHADGQKTEAFRLLMRGFYLENTEMFKRIK
jgi:tRNA1Val (adenine37-N6)-methyltransferase